MIALLCGFLFSHNGLKWEINKEKGISCANQMLNQKGETLGVMINKTLQL